MTLEEMATRIAVQAAELQRLRAAVEQQRAWIREMLAEQRSKKNGARHDGRERPAQKRP